MEFFFVNFFRCGMLGWAVEILFTCLGSLPLTNNRCLVGHTSLLMFPIYGLGALIPVAAVRLRQMQIGLAARGCIYAVSIFIVEYLSGSFLRLFQICPWDYSQCLFQINGLIRLDFFPFWFLLGIIFEKAGDTGPAPLSHHKKLY